jgi:hypothetical protein
MAGHKLTRRWKAWREKARERFIEFFEGRALVTRAQISLARKKQAEEEKARAQQSQNLKDQRKPGKG